MRNKMIVKNRESLYGYGVYAMKDVAGVVRYIGSGDIADRLSNHLYHLKRNLYSNTNKQILQDLYDMNSLEFEVIHVSAFNNEIKDMSIKQKEDLQSVLQVLEQFYYDMYKSTCCNTVSVIKKYSTSPTLETTMRRKAINNGELNPNCSKFTADRVREIKQLLNDGLGYQDIADRFNSTYGYIAQIKNGYRWASVKLDDGGFING